MVGSEARLKGFIEVMVGHLVLELGGNYSFQEFAEERKVGDRPVVVQIFRVQTRLLEDRSD